MSAEDLRFIPVDLTEMMNAGVLMAANESFFWPLGLALTWIYDPETGGAAGLHLREWHDPSGRVHPIATDHDAITMERRLKFARWVEGRRGMIAEEDR